MAATSSLPELSGLFCKAPPKTRFFSKETQPRKLPADFGHLTGKTEQNDANVRLRIQNDSMHLRMHVQENK